MGEVNNSHDEDDDDSISVRKGDIITGRAKTSVEIVGCTKFSELVDTSPNENNILEDP